MKPITVSDSARWALSRVQESAEAAAIAPDTTAARIALNAVWFALTDAQLAIDRAEAASRLNNWLATPEKAA